MKNTSVISTNQWSDFPFQLFIDEKKSSQKSNPPSKSTHKNRQPFKPFYQTPNKMESITMVKLLKDNFGIEEGGIRTFKTDYISTIDQTEYNGLRFKLQLTENTVVLNVLINEVSKTVSYWNLDTLLKSMNSKNVQKVNKSELIKLLKNGELRVKFNVSRIKDHGTLWSFKNSLSVPVPNVV